MLLASVSYVNLFSFPIIHSTLPYVVFKFLNFSEMKTYLALAVLCFITLTVAAQGPPIITDKPIMVGEKRIIFKTLTRVEVREDVRFFNAPFMTHYVIKPNLLVAAHIPLAGVNHFKHKHKQTGLGDLSVQMKYQFFRWDESRKTARAALKVQQFFPTGFDSHNYEISVGEWQTFAGLTFGYEALRYGLGANVGYHYVANRSDFFHYKISAGLPLMPLVYPPKQINLYFEYDGEVNLETGAHNLFLAQGIQYAIKRITFETAIKIPLIQNGTDQQKYTLLFGTRFII